MTTREDIVATARTFLNVPWVHQGRSMQGVDCVGLATMTAKINDLSTFDLTSYTRLPDGIELVKLLRTQMPENQPTMKFGLGDLLCFHSNGQPTHVGIVGDYKYGGFSLIHAFNAARPTSRVVEHRLDDTLWLPRVVASFRLIEAYR